MLEFLKVQTNTLKIIIILILCIFNFMCIYVSNKLYLAFLLTPQPQFMPIFCVHPRPFLNFPHLFCLTPSSTHYSFFKQHALFTRSPANKSSFSDRFSVFTEASRSRVQIELKSEE